ncbi:uncharacterized protein MELLADRAFT_113437 [Melampsora larici-populina 98AG31]|uniref:Uncharacterized protein n=1 Tax=Melampsora larici-populina (strain 98AG31 / pathotype 3-4-7) TaxID=747676 RepID=F4S9V6_MELLP|nr:uncharacterized protein MELLADRAFT_113437 [Melampsora larici-populina 98AG31]EGF98584.1 hypothetical protein MELLADRAFT_113437 [Melampsora larici-populina 98AG31]
MSLGVNRRSQPAYIASIFEVHAQVPATVNAAYGFQSVTSGLNCAGIDGNAPLEHDLLITYYAAQGVGLAVGNMHYTSGKFLPLNGDAVPRLVTELSHHIPAGDADTFSGCLTNNVALNSIGIVVSKRVLHKEAHEGKPTCVFLMRHTDYNPMTGKLCEFLLEYWCRPVRNLAKALNIIQLGKEMSIHGYIAGKNIQSEVIGGKEVYSLSVATGHESIRAGATLTTPTATRLTKGGRVRLQRPPTLIAPGISTVMSKPTAEDQAALASYLHQVSTPAGDENVNILADANAAGPINPQPNAQRTKRVNKLVFGDLLIACPTWPTLAKHVDPIATWVHLCSDPIPPALPRILIANAISGLEYTAAKRRLEWPVIDSVADCILGSRDFWSRP